MSDNPCVMCGAVIPEGRHVCPICEAKARLLQHVSLTEGQCVRRECTESTLYSVPVMGKVRSFLRRVRSVVKTCR